MRACDGAVLIALGCASCASGGVEAPCRPTTLPHYPEGSTYLGVHGGPRQNDVVACDTSEAFQRAWHALQGYAIAQPNTFSPDGAATYVTTSQPTPDDCTVWALRTEDGATVWCRDEPGAIGGSITVDANGHLFLTVEGALLSLDAAGTTRWRTALTDAAGAPVGAYGVHLTPEGHLATVTATGRLMLVDRDGGDVLAELDLPEAFGLLASLPAPALGFDDLIPPAVAEDFARVFGPEQGLLAIFSGAGATWTDNTVAIDADGRLYAVGVGADAASGAVVQIRQGGAGGAASAPQLSAGWRMPTVAGSASSPSISPDGRWLKVTDGNSVAALVAPESADASARIADVAACDANTDADPDPAVCAPAYVVPLRSGPAAGASPVLDDAEHYLWDVQLADLLNVDTPDVRRLDGDTTVWSTTLPDDAQWTSVLTLTDRHVLGTSSTLADSGERLLSIELPSTAQHAFTVLDRRDGSVVFLAPIPDDSTSTVTVGPDGSAYVTLLGLVSGFALDTPITGGLIAFRPTPP